MKEKITEFFKKISLYLRDKLGVRLYSYIHPYIHLVKRMAIGAYEGAVYEYRLWKNKR
jgi:hypothetical protein